MKYAEAVQMVKQASKWLPAVAEFGSKAQLAKALNTRLWQKAGQAARYGRRNMPGSFSFDVPKEVPYFGSGLIGRLSATDAFQAARQAMQTAPEGTTMASLYRTFRQDPDTLQGARILQNAFRTTPAETVPAYRLRDTVNRRLGIFDAYMNNPKTQAASIVPNKALVTARQLESRVPADASKPYRYELMQLKNLGKNLHASPTARPLTAADIRKEFNTNNLIFHGNSDGLNATAWLESTKDRPTWFSPLAPVSAAYALPETDWPGPERPVLSVFAMPDGALGDYTRKHMTPHFGDETGKRRDRSGWLRRFLMRHTNWYKGYGPDFMPNYEFVLQPEMRDAWLDASARIHAPKSYYVAGRLPRDVSTRTNLEEGLADASLNNLKFYDTTGGLPREIYEDIQNYINRQSERTRNQWKSYLAYYRPKGTIPVYEKPHELVFR